MRNEKLKNIFHLSSFIFHLERGQSLVELLLVIGLSAILLPALLTGFVASREGKAQHGQRTQAASLLKSTVEAVRSVREKGWSYFATNGTFHPEESGSSWILTDVPTGPVTIDGFTRQVVISDVKRTNGTIDTSGGGTLDPSTKKVVITVSWNAPYNSSVTSTLYMARYLGNNAFLQTTETDFNLGTKLDTVATNNAGGEVTLGAGNYNADWCIPSDPIAALDLPKSGVANALTAVAGRAFAGTGENSSGVSFANIDINNQNPPVASILGEFNGYKTNGIFGETNYAYLATDNNAKEIVIIDLNNIVAGKYQEAGYFNAPDNTQGKSVYVSGNTGYMTDGGNNLYSFDLSSKSGSRPLLDPDGITLVGIGIKVVVVGNYAYIAIKEGSDYEMQIVNVGNPNNLTLAGLTDVAPTQAAEEAHDIFVNGDGTRTYLVTNAEPAIREFFIIDTTTKTGNPPVIGQYDTNGMDTKGVAVTSNGKKAIIVGTGGEEYQAIDITTETAPVRCGGLNIDLGVNGVASVLEPDGEEYSYIITGDATSEFKIIGRGPIGHWKFDEAGGQIANDSSAFNNDGTLGTTSSVESPGPDPTWTSGKPGLGGALDFDGTDDVVTFGIPSSALNNRAAGTYSAWVKLSNTTFPTTAVIVARANSSLGQKLLSLNTSENIRAFVEYTGVLAESISTQSLSVGSWHHVAYTFNSQGADTKVRIYLNGQEVAYSTQTAGTGSIENDNTYNLVVGNNTDSTLDFPGQIDDVRIYDRALLATEIRYLYGQFVISGDFTSSAIDAVSQSAFNRFDVSVIRPASTDIKFQVATSDAVAGNCNNATYAFVGPDATPGTYFTTSVNGALTNYSYTIPLSLSPKRCSKYKAYLSTSNVALAPNLYDVTVNYSP